MALGISDYLANNLLDHVLRNEAYTPPATTHLALFTTATTAAGGGTEVVGGSYARQAVTWTVADLVTSENNDIVTFTNMPAVEVVAFAVMDAASGGNFLFYGPVSPSRTTTAGENLVVAAGDLAVAHGS